MIKMSRILICTFLFSLFLVADGLALSATVTHNGYSENDCFHWGTYKVCTSRTGFWQGVMTPANVRHWQYKYKASTKVVNGGEVVSSSSSNGKTMMKMKDGSTFLYKSTMKYNTEVGCMKVNYSADYQYVNGKIVRNKYNYQSAGSC